jgi:hypothetical protein
MATCFCYRLVFCFDGYKTINGDVGMKQRIVEETLANGKKQYRVESRTLLGNWQTESIYDAERDMYFSAIFNTLDDAKDFLCISNQVVSKKVIDI